MDSIKNAIHKSLYVGPKEHHFANFMSSNVKRRMLYNEKWTLEKITLFETIFQLSWSFGNPFFHSQGNIQKATRLGRRVFEKHRDELLEEGFISITRGANKGASFTWKVNIDHICNNIMSIYNFDLIPIDERKDTIQNAISFFRLKENGNVFYD